MDKRKAEVVVSVMLIALSAYIYLGQNLVQGGVESELGSLFLPRLVAAIMALLALSMGLKAMRSLRKTKQTTADQKIDLTGFSGVFAYVGILFFYWAFMPYIGFILATMTTMLLVAALLSAQRWLKVVLLVVVLAFAVNYGAKEFLNVYLPTGEWLD